VAATLDHTLAPTAPLGTEKYSARSVPVAWSNLRTPPRISGVSHCELRPTYTLPFATVGEDQSK
jgi:hypothetical protein